MSQPDPTLHASCVTYTLRPSRLPVIDKRVAKVPRAFSADKAVCEGQPSLQIRMEGVLFGAKCSLSCYLCANPSFTPRIVVPRRRWYSSASPVFMGSEEHTKSLRATSMVARVFSTELPRWGQGLVNGLAIHSSEVSQSHQFFRTFWAENVTSTVS